MSEPKQARVYIAPCADISATFEMTDVNWEQIGFLAEDIDQQPKPLVRPMTILIRGKRIWWKPWRRRPDKTIHMPRVEMHDNGDGTFTCDVEIGGQP